MPTDKRFNVQPQPDGTWTQEIQGATYVFREATGRERSRARNAAMLEAPNDPSILECGHLASFGVIQRKQPDGSLKPLSVDEVVDRGERFVGLLMTFYGMGLGSLQGEAKKGLISSSEATSPMEVSEKSVRP